MLALSYLLGWPALGMAGSASPWIGVEAAALLGSGTYALSWVLLGVAVVLGGNEVRAEGRRWTAMVAARLRPGAAVKASDSVMSDAGVAAGTEPDAAAD